MSDRRGPRRARDAPPHDDRVTVTAPVERRVVARGSKSEREATVALVGDRVVVLRRRGAPAFDDDAELAGLAGRVVRLTGTMLSTTLLVDEAVVAD